MDALSHRERAPDYHYVSEQSKAIIETLEGASLEAKAALADVMDQFFVHTATWGLTLWERQVGLTTDPSQSIDARRMAIKQQLVAEGNTTAEMVRGLAETITGYEARVTVNDDYSFSLSFWGETDRLADIDVSEVRSIVERIKPAHLRFVISAVTWGDLESVKLKWSYFDENTIAWAELEKTLCVHAKNKEDGL